MENASRALLMAATVLISVMVISLGTYLFATFGSYSKNINEKLSLKKNKNLMHNSPNMRQEIMHSIWYSNSNKPS